MAISDKISCKYIKSMEACRTSLVEGCANMQ